MLTFCLTKSDKSLLRNIVGILFDGYKEEVRMESGGIAKSVSKVSFKLHMFPLIAS